MRDKVRAKTLQNAIEVLTDQRVPMSTTVGVLGEIRDEIINASEPEPAGWRCKDHADGWFLTDAKGAYEYEHGCGGYCEPLYTRDALK